jgi:hypothetical protein
VTTFQNKLATLGSNQKKACDLFVCNLIVGLATILEKQDSFLDWSYQVGKYSHLNPLKSHKVADLSWDSRSSDRSEFQSQPKPNEDY